MDDTPSAFSVAHYVLLFIVSTLCTIAVVWILISINNRELSIHDKTLIINNSPKTCQRTTADKVTKIWETTPNEIPQQYKQMKKDFANRIVPVRTSGTCNGERFICQMGQIRATCDPCATNSAHKRALFQHISDAIDETCTNK